MCVFVCVCVRAGTVRVKLYKGNVTVTGRKSPYSLYDAVIASFEDDKGLYNQVCVCTRVCALNVLACVTCCMHHTRPDQQPHQL